MQKQYLQLLNGKLIQFKGEVDPNDNKGSRYVIFTTEFKDVDRGMSFSSIATQVVEESGLDVLVFTGPDQGKAVTEFLKAHEAQDSVRIHVSSHGVLCAYNCKSEDGKGQKNSMLQIKYEQKIVEWPKLIGIVDLNHVGDMYDFHLVFPYDAWRRTACKDAMACKRAQRLFVKCLHLFLIDNRLIKGFDRTKLFAETKELLQNQILRTSASAKDGKDD